MIGWSFRVCLGAEERKQWCDYRGIFLASCFALVLVLCVHARVMLAPLIHLFCRLLLSLCMCTRSFVHANDAKVMRSRDVQFNTEESPESLRR